MSATRCCAASTGSNARAAPPGNGLGLALVAAIADLHDATLTLGDNAPGLRVTLALPLHGKV
ncbi:MAG: hypothetical protein KatS3mg118_3228 [Paracoccaceae bacterium]|nr:MAG: hypothetical protein KatS3mg118_3228 [Paracoccaceae bacterium]